MTVTGAVLLFLVIGGIALVRAGVFAALGDPAPAGASTVVPTVEVP